MTLHWVIFGLALVAFSVHDIWKRTIPPSLCAAVALLILGGWAMGAVTWWWSSAVLGALIFWLGTLPMGDRAGIFLVAGLLPPDAAAVLVWAAGSVGLLYVAGVGRYRSMIGFPFFPAVAICAMVVAAWVMHR
jgi:hypothetical protein